MWYKFLLIAIFFLLILLSDYLKASADTSGTKIVFCDVGQGDATLIQKGNWQLLIDAGPDEKVVSCLKSHLPWGDTTIDWVLITHPHSDHFEGIKSLLGSYKISNMIIDDLPQTDSSYLEFYSLITEKVVAQQIKIYSSQLSMKWRFFDDLHLQIVFSVSNVLSEKIFEKKLENSILSDIETKSTQIIKNVNNSSIGIILNIEDVLFTFTGDLEKDGELALVQSGLLTESTVLKVPHHGSKTSSTTQFLEKVSPEICVVSAGYKNRYGHPHADVLERLEAVACKILRTDQMGEIVLKVKDRQLWWLNDVDESNYSLWSLVKASKTAFYLDTDKMYHLRYNKARRHYEI